MTRFPPLAPKGGMLAAIIVLAAGCAAPETSLPGENPPELESILRQGADAETSGQGPAAGAAYERATREFADYGVAWSRLGEYHRFWGHDPAEAETAFRRAINAPITTQAAVASAWRGLGEISRSRGDVQGAIERFNKSLSVQPSAEAHRSLSALYATEQRDFGNAAFHARAAVELSPDDPIALLQFAVQMIRLQKPADAEAAFARAITIAGCDAKGRSNSLVHCCVLYNGACYHAVRGDKAGALAMLKEFFLSPNHRHITREEIERDPDFLGLVKDADFIALLDYRLPEE